MFLLNKLLNRNFLINKTIRINFYRSMSDNQPQKPESQRFEQDKFYFIESRLTKNMKKETKLYTQTYQQIPVVLVLGWAGAIDRHVRKYTDIYCDLGYHTLRFSPSNSLTFFNHKSHQKYAYEMLDLMKNEYKLTQNPIAVHFFSNASCFIIYQHIINEISLNQQSEYRFFEHNHKAIIYDSAPGLPHSFLGLFSGINDLVKQQVKNPFFAYPLTLGFLTIVAMIKLKPDNYFIKMYDILVNDYRQVPSLYLYSTSDKLISDKSIKELIEKRKTKHPGLYVKEVLYTDSEHVLIFQKHPQEYLNLICDHLKICNLDINTLLKNDLKSKL